ncbi:MAG: hypothetical protein ACRCWQ_09215 [Bacilli bacterium]
MKFLTLIELELKKLSPIILSIYALASTLLGWFFYSNIKEVKLDILQKSSGQSFADFAKENGTVTLAKIIDESASFTMLFILVGLAIIGLTLFVWYKDWFGSSKRIYMLLTLSGNRLQVLGSKVIAMVLSLISFYFFVLFNLFIGSQLMQILLDKALVSKNLIVGALQQSMMLQFIVPSDPLQLLYKFAFGVMMIAIITTFVLLDRSRRIFGAIAGCIFGASTVSIFMYIQMLHLFYDERPLVEWGFVGIVTLLCGVLSTYLLQKKISI